MCQSTRRSIDGLENGLMEFNRSEALGDEQQILVFA